MSIPVVTIDATGIHLPTFPEIIEGLQASYRAIYGADVYLGNDSQDGQFIGLLAVSIAASNIAAWAAFNSFSPATAQGAGLSSVVKINGITRNVPTYSTWDVNIIGQAGTEITDGVFSDENNNQWALPALVTIPIEGTVVVTATAKAIGEILGSVPSIVTITAGWQDITSAGTPSAGAAVETDAQLRARQAQSTMLPSVYLTDAITGQIMALGVTRVKVYENDTGGYDANGIPGHCIAAVVEGGNATAIAQVILWHKNSSGTYGTTAIVLIDNAGIPHTVRFSRPIRPQVYADITIKAKRGYTSTIGTQIKQAFSDWVNNIGIGNNVEWGPTFTAINLTGAAAATFEITALLLARDSNTPVEGDVVVLFNEDAICGSLSNVTLTVTT